jgi:hypothetical protein
MKKPSPIVVLPLVAAVYGPPLFHVAKQAIGGNKITQKLPPAHGISVVTTASSTDTGATGPAVTVDMNTGKLIRVLPPPKPGQMVQLPIKGSDTDPTDTG